MKQKNNTLKANPIKTLKLILLSTCIVTLYFYPRFADPFNSAKMYLIILATSLLFVPIFVLAHPLRTSRNDLKLFKVLIALFIISLLIATLGTDVKYNAIFGEVQRQTGILSYLSLAMFMYATAKYYTSDILSYFFNLVLGLSTIYFIYGLLQYTGNDPFEWNNQYNPIIGTLGNPNFAAAFMAMLAVLCWGYMFIGQITLPRKLLALVIFLGLSLNILLSNARQGILTLIIGISIYTVIVIKRKNKYFGIIGLLILVVASFFAIAAMLQSGPFEKWLYKDSVSLRGYYWRAGINMFLNNPVFGVGIERYGANFKLYRESGYAEKYGYDLISTNAHNVPIQFFATGGFLLGTTYLILQLYVFLQSINKMKNYEGDNFLFFLAVFCAWLVFQFQSIVSIDNLGLTIWGWVLAGCLVGWPKALNTLKAQTRDTDPHQNNSLIQFSPLIQGTVVVIAFIFVLFLSKGESNLMEARDRYNPNVKDNSNAIKVFTEKVINDPLAQPAYKLEAANYLIQSGFEIEGLNEFKRLADQNRIHPTFLIPLASMYEYKGRFEEAISVRESIIEYDPDNLNNYLQLARLYKDTNNQFKALKMRDIILSLGPNTDQAKSVLNEINF